MSIINLNSKQEYLESVTVWKAAYVDLVNDIREAKKIIHQPHGARGWWPNLSDYQKAQSNLVSLKRHARELLEERVEGKRISSELKKKQEA